MPGNRHCGVRRAFERQWFRCATLYLVYQDNSSADYVYWGSLASGSSAWTNLQTIADFKTSDSPALAVQDGTLFLVYKSNNDSYIYYSFLQGDGNWCTKGQLQTMGSSSGYDTATCGPALAGGADVPGVTLFMAYVGTGSDGLYLNTCSGA
jgi:hypothetical protein